MNEKKRVKRAGNDNRPGARAARPTAAQMRYLSRGLNEPGGKLPIFDHYGGEIPAATIKSCIAHGWAEPWISNPTKRNWMVCKLTPEGYRILAGRRAGVKSGSVAR
jgi:hypothetical protein